MRSWAQVRRNFTWEMRMALIGREQHKVLEVLSDGVARDANTILKHGCDVLHLGSILKVLLEMVDEGLLQEHNIQPKLFSITDAGREALKAA